MLINLLIINMEKIKLKRKSKVSVFELLVLTGCIIRVSGKLPTYPSPPLIQY